jgi:phosphate transport system ATP-binding protein
MDDLVRYPAHAPVMNTTPIVSVGALSVSYGGQAAVRDISFDIAKGTITAIVGPSGCGKSTLLSCLNRMTDLIPGCHVSGSIQIAGQDILKDPVDLIALRRQVGMIFQRPNPFPLSIQENIAFPLRHHGLRDSRALQETVQTALTSVGLWAEVKDRLNASALALSGGQQQRLCLARALALQPEIILLDEPCSALDPISSGIVEDLIASLAGRYTIVIVTHNLAQARRIANSVAVLWVENGAGRLIEHGPVEEVFTSPQHPVSAMYISGARG